MILAILSLALVTCGMIGVFMIDRINKDRMSRVRCFGKAPKGGKTLEERRLKPEGDKVVWNRPEPLTPLDIYLDPELTWTDKKTGQKAIEIDLDTGHLIEYQGIINNESPAYRKLPGDRLYAIRKDIRVRQFGNPDTGLGMALVKFGSIAAILTVIMIPVVLFMLAKASERV